MFWLLHRFCTFIGFIFLCGVGLFYSRDLWANWLLCWLLSHATTFGCQIDRVTIEPHWPTRVHLQSVTIRNPTDFSDTLALEIPEVNLELSSEAWDQDQLNIRWVDVEISRINLVHSEPGGNNLTRFNTVAQRDRETPCHFHCQTLQLRITDPRFFGLHRYREVDSLAKVAHILDDLVLHPAS